MRGFFVLFFALLALGSGCASRHEQMRGSVALKISDSAGVACLFGDRPEVGDGLVLYRNVCTSIDKGKDGSGRNCKMVASGEARVTKLLNDHYAEFVTSTQFPFEEGSVIKLSSK